MLDVNYSKEDTAFLKQTNKFKRQIVDVLNSTDYAYLKSIFDGKSKRGKIPIFGCYLNPLLLDKICKENNISRKELEKVAGTENMYLLSTHFSLNVDKYSIEIAALPLILAFKLTLNMKTLASFVIAPTIKKLIRTKKLSTDPAAYGLVLGLVETFSHWNSRPLTTGERGVVFGRIKNFVYMYALYNLLKDVRVEERLLIISTSTRYAVPTVVSYLNLCGIYDEKLATVARLCAENRGRVVTLWKKHAKISDLGVRINDVSKESGLPVEIVKLCLAELEYIRKSALNYRSETPPVGKCPDEDALKSLIEQICETFAENPKDLCKALLGLPLPKEYKKVFLTLFKHFNN